MPCIHSRWDRGFFLFRARNAAIAMDGGSSVGWLNLLLLTNFDGLRCDKGMGLTSTRWSRSVEYGA
eukprot:scaffold165086_cov35-Tisochrysis_lutea.AAC.3